jgi:molybdopterin-synthase adenylyltransferase
MTSPLTLSQELTSPEERQHRRTEAEAALARGDNPIAYWAEHPQLNTVGYLTTIAGSLLASYAIGWITGAFDVPFSRSQFNLVAKLFDVTDLTQHARAECPCRRIRGWADQGSPDALMTAPDHWAPPKRW